MSDPELPKRGERVTIHWPDGPHDFVVEFSHAERVTMPGWEDWVVIHGVCVEPEGLEHRQARSFFVKPVADGYALIPKLSTPRP